MITDEMVGAALRAYYAAPSDTIRAVLAAVAPMIAAGEREACVAICEDVFSGSAGIALHPALRIADLIRARTTSQASEPPPPSE